ncbi:acyl-CoA dehydrogenase family protein [Pararobbsia silviterrae]|uniref:3-methylmercaptopropionyl-CoA dehydrogenase n=1 Tax=Pararobbsia silviterrae TaxID=1792498 RepID=A0A494XIV3_9BURK|nr:acyl-CoA dehydrogenase family protein [Pararobbsia silviterrae]RKP49692.1 acyl-CoA dehydrogenase [Pararobbsia silviterrae]
MTVSYQAPLRDMRFVIEEWLDAPRDWQRVDAWATLDAGTVEHVLGEAARFVSEQLAPLDGPGDLEGCRFVDGQVSTPRGFRETYRAFVEGGWPTLALAEDAGGQGLPQLLDAALQEMLAAANHAWLMSPGLTHGATACLYAHGSDALKRDYLPKIASGEWLTTMCLTEPQAGSDLGLIRTRAEVDTEADADSGGYRITGSKIFITGGEHDLTDNIVHLVLARLPDAPAGTRGLSLFLVPKWIARGGVCGHEGDRERNGVHCDGIEKKMGLKASPTCAMRFEHARGWLIGEPHRGLASMFVMMNAARLQVAMQGVGHAQFAWQRASAYATERLQMRAVSAPPGTHAPAPIAAHPAMRRILMDIRTTVEGARAIGYWIAHGLDIAAHDPDPDARARAEQMAALLTPVAKAFFTAHGFACASNALQVFGGYGYIHEYGIEQTVRDSRVSMLYEGTNEIQAIDLLVRKVIGDGGERLRMLLDTLVAEADRCTAGHDSTERGPSAAYADALVAKAHVLRSMCMHVDVLSTALARDSVADAELPYRVADDYLAMLGWLLLTFAWLRTARVAHREPAHEACARDAFYAGKRAAAAYFFDYRVAEFEHRRRLVEAGLRADLPCDAALSGASDVM